MKHSTIASPQLAIIGVTYQEFKPETYQGVTVAVKGNETKIFNDNGSFKDDYDNAYEYARSIGKVLHSSKVHHYMTDINMI